MSRAALIIAVAALVTVALRFLPFLLFGGKRETPPFIAYLGRVLPSAIMAMLVVYCLRNVQLTASPFGIPELLSCAVVVLLHVWKRNTIVSTRYKAVTASNIHRWDTADRTIEAARAA